MKVGNLLDCPTFKLEDRRTICQRVLAALLADPDCRYSLSRGEWRQLTDDETANWEARQHFLIVGLSYAPATPDVSLDQADAGKILDSVASPTGS